MILDPAGTISGYFPSPAASPQRVTFGPSDYWPVWSPDGKQIAYAVDENGKYSDPPPLSRWQPARGGSVSGRLLYQRISRRLVARRKVSFSRSGNERWSLFELDSALNRPASMVGRSRLSPLFSCPSTPRIAGRFFSLTASTSSISRSTMIPQSQADDRPLPSRLGGQGSVNRLLFKSKSNAIYADGYLIFARNEQLLAQPFNLSSGTLSGELQLLAKDVANDPTTWHMDVAASNNGLLLYGTGGGDYGTMELFWVDRTTKKQSTIAGGLTNVNNYSLSPQGDRIALEMDNGVSDIWVQEITRGVRTRLTFGPIYNNGPRWSPDGKWILYTSNRNGRFQLFRKLSDGGGAEEESA